MSKNKNDHKKPVVAKDRFVGVRLDMENFLKVEEAAMAAGLSISGYIRTALTHKKITIKEEIVLEVPVIKELIAALGKIGANPNRIAHHFSAGDVLSQQMYRETMKVYADLYAVKFEVEKLGGTFRSHPKAYGRKNSDDGQMQQYLLFQHEWDSAKPMHDDGFRTLLRCMHDQLHRLRLGRGAYLGREVRGKSWRARR